MDSRMKRVQFNNESSIHEVPVAIPESEILTVQQLDSEENSVHDQESSDCIQNQIKSFTIWDEVVIITLSVFYILDMILDILVAVKFFTRDDPKYGWFVVFAILLPNLYVGYKSLQWYLRAHDYEPIRSPWPWIIRIAFFPVSLLLRYYETFKFGRGSKFARKSNDRVTSKRLLAAFLVESVEVSLLRLFIVFLEDAPIATLIIADAIQTPSQRQSQNFGLLSIVMFKLIFTMTLGVVHYLTALKATYHAAQLQDQPSTGSDRKFSGVQQGDLPIAAQLGACGWHLCLISSRVMAYAMTFAVIKTKLWILVCLRWILNGIWIKSDGQDVSLSNAIAFGGIYCFTFLPTTSKHQFLRVVVYYLMTILENVIVAVVFGSMMENNDYSSEVFIGSMFGSCILSIFLMSIYYIYLHPKKPESFSMRFVKTRIGIR